MEFKKVSDQQLVSLVRSELDDAVSYFDSEVAQNRQENYGYYSSALPAQKQRGRSKYVSGDVFDVVESLKSSLLETFSGNRTLVEFTPQGMDDVEACNIATEYTNYVFYRQNNGYSVLHDAIHDGLMYRIGVVKAYWKVCSVLEEFEFSNLTYGQLEQLLAQDGIEDVQVEEQDLGLTVLLSGSYKQRRDTSHLAVDNIAPEEFVVSSKAKSINEARIVAHRIETSISDLIKEGIDEKLAKKAYESAKNGEDNTAEPTDFFNEYSESDSSQQQTEKFWIYEVYVEVDTEGTGEATLMKITLAGDVVLDKEEVSDKPFFVFSPLARPHSLIGEDFIERLKPIQNAKTTLTRSVIDHTVITNNPRHIVLKGTINNPRELLDDRLGGLVNATRPDAITPMMQSPMNPFAFNTIQMLDDNKEQTTGVSRLSQGLNKDAVSKQNSSDMVNGMVSLSQQRQKTIARNFGERFLKPLMIYIYKLVIENEDKESIFEVAGNYVEVNPTTWNERKDANIQFSIGYQEAEREAQELLGYYQMMAQDPVLAQGFGYDKRFAAWSKIMATKGHKDIQNWLTAPQQIQPPQPSPMEQLEVEQAKQAMQINERQTANMERKLALEERKFMQTAELNELRTESEMLAKADKQRLDEDKFEHAVNMDIFEQAIVKQKADEGEITASANVTTGGK